jgi:hypothetical protein
MGKGQVTPEKPITPSKEHIFICISHQIFHVGVPNLIYIDHPRTHIIQQHQHLKVYLPLPSLLIYKPIFHP